MAIEANRMLDAQPPQPCDSDAQTEGSAEPIFYPLENPINETMLLSLTLDKALIPEARTLGLASLTLDHVAKLYNYDRSLWPTTRTFVDNEYYEVAAHLRTHKHSHKIEAFLEILDEMLLDSPGHTQTIARYANHMSKLVTLGTKGEEAAIAVKLWAALDANLDLPSYLDEIKANAHTAKLKAQRNSGFAPSSY